MLILLIHEFALFLKLDQFSSILQRSLFQNWNLTVSSLQLFLVIQFFQLQMSHRILQVTLDLVKELNLNEKWKEHWKLGCRNCLSSMICGWGFNSNIKQDRFTTCCKTCGTNCWCKNVFKKCLKKLTAAKLNKVRHLQHRQTCYQTSGNRIGLIWPDFYVVWTIFPDFWGQKKQKLEPGKNLPENQWKR